LKGKSFTDGAFWGDAAAHFFVGALTGAVGASAAFMALKSVEFNLAAQARMSAIGDSLKRWLGQSILGDFVNVSRQALTNMRDSFRRAFNDVWQRQNQGGDLDLNPLDFGQQLSILPLGDAVTFGSGSSDGGGYRCRLAGGLDYQQNTYQMRGSLSSGPCGHPANEDHVGATIGDIQGLEGCAVGELQPNIVLLDVGTTDLNNDGDADAAVSATKKPAEPDPAGRSRRHGRRRRPDPRLERVDRGVDAHVQPATGELRGRRLDGRGSRRLRPTCPASPRTTWAAASTPTTTVTTTWRWPGAWRSTRRAPTAGSTSPTPARVTAAAAVARPARCGPWTCG
jgi:hypothetical protein